MARNRSDVNQPTSHNVDEFDGNLTKTRASFKNENNKKKTSSKRFNELEKNIGIWTTQNQNGNWKKVSILNSQTGETRAMKTLGWFMQNPTDVKESPSSQSPSTDQHTRNLNKGKTLNGGKMNVEEKSQKRWKLRTNKNLSVGTAQNQTSQLSTGIIGDIHQVGQGKSSPQQDYCYYDVDSDGFYYQTRGTCGWKKRSASTLAEGQAAQKAFMDSYLKAQIARCGRIPVSHYVSPVQQSSAAYQTYLGQHQYYDAITDGFYFEMPSADGWKKRQPGFAYRQQTMLPSTSFPQKSQLIGEQSNSATSFDVVGLSDTQAFDRHNSLTNSLQPIVNHNKDAVPINSSAVSTFSSADDNSTPPLHNLSTVNQIGPVFPSGSNSIDHLSAHYNALRLNDIEKSEFCQGTFGKAYPFLLQRSSEIEDLENKPPAILGSQKEKINDEKCVKSNSSYKVCDDRMKQERCIRSDALKNFDADQFIKDLSFIFGDDMIQRKSVCAEASQDEHASQMWSTSLSQPPLSSGLNLMPQAESDYNEIGIGQFLDMDDLKDSRTTEPRAKSKLGFWQNPSAHLKPVSCNNN